MLFSLVRCIFYISVFVLWTQSVYTHILVICVYMCCCLHKIFKQFLHGGSFVISLLCVAAFGLSYIIICQLWLRICVAWKSRRRDFRWCEVSIDISGREARERVKWNEHSPLVLYICQCLAMEMVLYF